MPTPTICWIATLFLTLSCGSSESKNMVFLPAPGTSHARLHAIAAVELVKMGHSVWVGFPSALYKRNENFPGVNIFNFNDFWEFTEENLSSNFEGTVSDAVASGADPDWSWLYAIQDTFSEIYFEAMTKGKLTEYVESLNPDLIVVDGFPNVDERIAIAYKLNIPFAVLTTLYDPITIKMPLNPVAQIYNSPYMRSKATLFEKMLAVMQQITPIFRHLFNDRGYMKQMFPTDPNVPPSNELMSQAEVYIIQSDPINDYPLPSVPNMKFIGGVSVSPAKVLLEPFKSFVERSEKAGVGVAVLSFGSLIMNLHADMEAKIMAALKRVSVNTIWRANITSPDPDKILTSTWLPVNDLLGHKNVKLFISHSGGNSMYEALYHAVPTVCIPIFYDQHPNAERAADKGFCLNLDILKASSDELVTAIEKVVSSKEMKATISTASEIYRQLYKNPGLEAAFWLDHVMRYGGSYMRYSGQKLPMILFVMDYILVFLIGVVATLTVLLLAYVNQLIYRACFTSVPDIGKKIK
ncbi:hypothetical protein BsWGS_27743 [Bradybaena similaris]